MEQFISTHTYIKGDIALLAQFFLNHCTVVHTVFNYVSGSWCGSVITVRMYVRYIILLGNLGCCSVLCGGLCQSGDRCGSWYGGLLHHALLCSCARCVCVCVRACVCVCVCVCANKEYNFVVIMNGQISN